MDWVKQAAAGDYFVNTPSNMAIHVSQLVCEHMLNQGGLDYYESLASKRADLLYSFMDATVQEGIHV